MSTVGRGRVVLGALGFLLAAYGGWLLLSRQDTAGNLDTLLWLAGGVVVHDALLAPVVIGLGVLLSRLAPAPTRAAAWRRGPPADPRAARGTTS